MVKRVERTRGAKRSERLLLVQQAQVGPKDGEARCIFITLLAL